jgi:large subunit ribosomal protein L28
MDRLIDDPTYGMIPAARDQDCALWKGLTMAKCENCGKTTTFGQNRSFSMKATKRKFRPNLQKVRVLENGRMVQKTLCTKCIKRLARV